MNPNNPSFAQVAYVPFEGEASSWHDGFARYDYVMEGERISPFKRSDSEGFGVAAPAEGQRRCVVICPKHPAPGNPWSWRGCYWDHQPQTEVELLRRGFHVAYISADSNLKPDSHWESWYAYLTEKHGLSKKPVFVGMSRGGQYALRWATSHPDKVGAIYADNPGGDDDIFRGLPDLARQDVPLLFVVGTNDPLLSRFAGPFETIYQQFGGRASTLIKEGAGHHPHSLNDPKPIADFLEKSVLDSAPALPAFADGSKLARSNYYSLAGGFKWHPEDGYYIASHGAAFSPCYAQYALPLGFDTPVTIIVPKTEAPGRPWVLRSNFVRRDALLDQALLAQGLHIVVGPVGYNWDGPKLAEWNKMYDYLVAHGFARKPVLEGEGGGAGAVYGWAVENPDKVACIYAVDPIMHAAGVEAQPLDRLEGLARAGVPVMHVALGSEPSLVAEQGEMERRYLSFGGKITVVRESSLPKAVDFIRSHSH